MNEITPRIETLALKKLVGLSMPMSMVENRTAELWRTFMPRRGEITNAIGSELYSLQVYPSSYFSEFNPSRLFVKWALVEVGKVDDIPVGMAEFSLPGGTYAVFDYSGLPSDPAIFEYIFQRWLPHSGYALAERPHFEVLGERYRNGDPNSEEQIWIPIRAQDVG